MSASDPHGRPADGPDTGAPTTLVLVRHGRTVLTEQRRMSGAGGEDPPLSELGRSDAARALATARRLGLDDPHAVLASPLRRAQETAETLRAPAAAPVVTATDWAEVSLGEWEGLTYAEVIAGWPDLMRRWQGSTAVAPPGGETLDEYAERIRRARAQVVAAHPGRTITLVCHLAPVRVCLQEALDAGPIALWRTRIDPGSLTVLRYWADGGVEVVTVNA